MYFSRYINTVDSHTAGEPTRVVTGGIPHLPGKTMVEKMTYMKKELDTVRTILMREPRGHRDMFGAVLTEPVTPGADIGVLFINAGGYLNMCGHGSIGCVTVALKTGILPITEPLTEVVLDTPSGLVRTRAYIEKGRVTRVSMVNVPSFVMEKDRPIDVPGLGTVAVDIVYGGNIFALVPAEIIGVTICGEKASELVDKGMRIKAAVNDQVKVTHPEKPHLNTVDLVEIYEKRSRLHGLNAVVFGDGALDRSPCGTGTSAKLAFLHARGDIKTGEDYIQESPIGTTMQGRILEETEVSGIPAVLPEVSARAFITSFAGFVVDPDDPMKDGFLLAT